VLSSNRAARSTASAAASCAGLTTLQHGSGIVHLVLAFIAFTAIAIGAVLISASLMSDSAWHRAAPVMLGLSIAAVVAYLLLGAALKHHHSPGGLYERIFLGLELLWIAVAAIAIARRDPATQPE